MWPAPKFVEPSKCGLAMSPNKHHKDINSIPFTLIKHEESFCQTLFK